jgi:hypothetical protein
MIRGMGMDFLTLGTKRSSPETALGINHMQKSQMALNFVGFKVASSQRCARPYSEDRSFFRGDPPAKARSRARGG